MPRPMKPTKAMSWRASKAYKPKLKRPKAKLQLKTMIRPKAKFWPEATPEAKLWPKAGPEAMFWPEAAPEAKFWPKAKCSHSPSQNIVWSFWRIRNILELQDMTIIFQAPSEFRIKLFIIICGACPPSEIIIEINLTISWEGLFLRVVWDLLEPNRAPSESELTINLRGWLSLKCE